jgi:hypothetical protein
VENKLIGEGDEINATTLPKVLMPNRGNFGIRFPDRIWSGSSWPGFRARTWPCWAAKTF